MPARIKVIIACSFILGCLLGGFMVRMWMDQSWIPPKIADSYKVELRELRKAIDGPCRTAIKDLNACEDEREGLRKAVLQKCNNVIKYAVMLELENSWLNKLVDHCKCDRSNIPES